MRGKLNFSKPIINRKKRLVSCTIDSCTDMLTEVDHHCSRTTHVIATAAGVKMWVMDGAHPRLSGTAVCHPEDTFDEEVGYRVAQAKANRKYHVRMAKDYRKVIRILQKAIDQLTPLMNYHQEQVDNLDQKLREMQD